MESIKSFAFLYIFPGTIDSDICVFCVPSSIEKASNYGVMELDAEVKKTNIFI